MNSRRSYQPGKLNTANLIIYDIPRMLYKDSFAEMSILCDLLHIHEAKLHISAIAFWWVP